jgi:beta-1,4-N-acetylglucosaminyltransferase
LSAKNTVLLVIYGAGGHKSEMRRLLQYLNDVSSPEIVSLGSGPLLCNELAHYEISDVRSKKSRLKSLLLFLPIVLMTLLKVVDIVRRYRVVGVISTGPGLCIMPMLLLRSIGIKTVFLETFCRFESRSMTGRIMYKIAHRFLIQNRQLQALYPDAQYSGRL